MVLLGAVAESMRNKVVARLVRAISRATTGDLQRAAEFLEFAREVRTGCTKQRQRARAKQAQPKDAPARW